MSKISLTSKSSYFFPCPGCGDEHNVTHLVPFAPKEFGTWYCKKCGLGVRGIIYPDGSVEIEPSGDHITQTAVLLKLPGQPIFLVVKGTQFGSGENDRFHYEESTCPGNYLRQVVSVVQDRRPDPHGLFSYLAAVPIAHEYLQSDCFSNMPFEEIDKLFSGLLSENI